MKSKIIIPALTFILVWALTLGGARIANAVLISPSADGNVWRHFSREVYSIDTADVNVSANFNPIEELRGIMEFPVDSIPAGTLVNSATLRLYVDATGGDNGTTGSFQLCGFVGDGAVVTSDWNSDGLALQNFANAVASFGPRTFDVTAFVQTLVSDGDSYSGFLFKGFTPNVLVGFASMEGNPGFPRPVLDVQYSAVPEPGSLALLLVVGSVAALGRRTLRMHPPQGAYESVPAARE